MKMKILLFSFLFAFSFIANTYAANINWNGMGDGTSWTDGANWAGGAMPGPADNAVFPSSIPNVTVVQGAGTPNTIGGLWAFNNVTLALSLDLTVSGMQDPVRVFNNNCITFKSGFTFNITATGGNAIIFWQSNSKIIIEAGATVNLNGPNGIGSRFSSTAATVENFGTLNITAVANAIRPNNATAMSVINHECATINLLGAARIRMWSNAATSTIVNNGLVTYGDPMLSVVSVSAGNGSTNNGFFSSANALFATGAGSPKIENGFNVGTTLPAAIPLNAGGTCSVTLPIGIPSTVYGDPGATMPIGTSTMGGAVTFAPGAFAAPGTNTVYTCYPSISYSVSNVSGTCTAPVVPTMSEWGLFVLGLIVLIIGTLALAFESKPAMVTTTGATVNTKFSLSNLPFERNYFFKAFTFVFVLFVVIFMGSIMAFGYEMTSADPYGSIIASALIAYWLMIFKMEKEEA